MEDVTKLKKELIEYIKFAIPKTMHQEYFIANINQFFKELKKKKSLTNTR